MVIHWWAWCSPRLISFYWINPVMTNVLSYEIHFAEIQYSCFWRICALVANGEFHVGYLPVSVGSVHVCGITVISVPPQPHRMKYFLRVMYTAGKYSRVCVSVDVCIVFDVKDVKAGYKLTLLIGHLIIHTLCWYVLSVGCTAHIEMRLCSLNGFHRSFEGKLYEIKRWVDILVRELISISVWSPDSRFPKR